VRVGIIGAGIRGSQLLRGLGFATPEYVEELKQQSLKDSKNTRYADFMEQEDLRIQLTAVCDVFDNHAYDGIKAGA
ncbi:MAG TPA: oxidoreductase, partial [Porphyromonadaceae bacterium]|nr:oxidoreductase [Porphyromonadaceae bacterium]